MVSREGEKFPLQSTVPWCGMQLAGLALHIFLLNINILQNPSLRNGPSVTTTAQVRYKTTSQPPNAEQKVFIMNKNEQTPSCIGLPK